MTNQSRRKKHEDQGWISRPAVGFDLNEGEGVICCSCFLDTLENHEMPELLVAVTTPRVIVRGGALCARCGLPYLREETIEAARQIRYKWIQDKP